MLVNYEDTSNSNLQSPHTLSACVCALLIRNKKAAKYTAQYAPRIRNSVCGCGCGDRLGRLCIDID